LNKNILSPNTLEVNSKEKSIADELDGAFDGITNTPLEESLPPIAPASSLPPIAPVSSLPPIAPVSSLPPIAPVSSLPPIEASSQEATLNVAFTTQDEDLTFDESLDDFTLNVDLAVVEAAPPQEVPEEEEFVVDEASEAYATAVAQDDISFAFEEIPEDVWTPCKPHNDVFAPWKRSQRCAALVAIRAKHAVSLPEAEAKLAEQVATLGAQSTTIEDLELYSKKRIALEQSQKQALMELEEQLQKRERTIATSWLRTTYLTLEMDPATKAAYFESVVMRADLSPAWWDRVTILALASASCVNEEGKLEVLPEEDVALLWHERLPSSRMPIKTWMRRCSFLKMR